MRKAINLTKGLNLNLRGGLTDVQPAATVVPQRVAVTPADFPGFTPKLEVAEGDAVVQGQPLMHDKTYTDIKLTAPTGGVVESIVRGERRRIERVIIRTSAEQTAPTIIKANSGNASSVASALKASGLWAMMRQRPYDIVPDPTQTPRDIFVTAMDTAPLALNPATVVAGKTAQIEAGVAALAQLTSGRIYIGVAANSDFPDIKGCEIVEFTPLHPAGNAGIQAANICPVNKGETVWTLDITTLAAIGSLMLSGVADMTVAVAVTGAEVERPQVVTTCPGADIADIVKGNIKASDIHLRYIAGNVLTGIPEGLDGYLRYPYRQVTVIPEGDDADEFMGWASLSPSKMSVSRSFLGKFLGRKFNPDARINGGRRAMIMSEVYDRYLPMDILPEQLIKAIGAHDIDKMEALGIYEVAPEDFALAEYADPSKIELQKIVREGLDYLRREV
ncbi:MAG: Na(+)-translocating NADH-quinone reductase subunit A [Duncaniella sp.]|nr:Na(+)-translocating NADH-quinone reductase subunit A [Duncaniella sp.]